MGAWGVGPFENDGAGDFEAELCVFHAADPAFLRATLQSLDPEEYIEADQGQALVACAAVVAALRGMERLGLAERLRDWLDANAGTPTDELAPLALQALAAVSGAPERSELLELWQDTPDYDNWAATISRLARALSD